MTGLARQLLNMPVATGVTFEIVLVTVDLARQWLDLRAENQRKVERSWVLRLADMIRNGDFRLEPHGIAFDQDLRLIDGQHRLLAIIEAGIPVQMVVSYGWSPTAIFGIDQGNVRRRHEIVAMSGRGHLVGSNGKMVEAMSTRMMVGNAGTKGYLSAEGLSRFLESHHEAIHFAIQACEGHKKQRGVHVAPVLAAVARASYHLTAEQKDRLRRFVEVLMTGFASSDDERPAILLRNFLLSPLKHGGSRNSNQAGMIYAKTTRAIKAFIGREPITKLVEPVEDIYPLPGDEREAIQTPAALLFGEATGRIDATRRH